MVWQKYYDLEPVRRLHFEGRELLGEYIEMCKQKRKLSVCEDCPIDHSPCTMKDKEHCCGCLCADCTPDNPICDEDDI